MTAIRQDIIIEQGADFDTPFSFDASITIERAALQIRKEYGAAGAVVTLTSDDGGGLVVDNDNRFIKPFISEDATADLVAGDYVYDLKAVISDGHTRRLYQGVATVSPEVTTIDLPVNPENAIATEDGGAILQEDGTKILTEDSP